jgi:hypothetical protein
MSPVLVYKFPQFPSQCLEFQKKCEPGKVGKRQKVRQPLIAGIRRGDLTMIPFRQRSPQLPLSPGFRAVFGCGKASVSADRVNVRSG